MTTIKKITIWKLLLVMVMISMLASACGGRKTPSATPAPTPANTPVPLPPVLVETSPLANSQLGARSPITFYFDQPMQRSAVEGALKLDPATPGRFEWLDDATVRFVPDADLPSASQVKVSIGSSALSKQGQALVNPVDLNFTTAGALLVAEKLPSPGSNEVDPTSAVVVTFNQPVIALGGEPSDAKPAFSISPAVKGTGKWLNTSTYIFYPEKSMDGGKTYQVSLDGDLKSVSGSPLESGQALGWNFSTAMPALISIEPATDVPLWRDGKVTITFNQPMDQKTVEENVELAPAGGPALAVSYAWNDTGTSLTIQPKELMEYGATVNLTLKSGVSALGGQAIGFSESYLYKVVEPFQVTGTSPGATELLESYSGFAGVTVDFSGPVQDGDLMPFVTVEPAVDGLDAYAGYDATSLGISGGFKPSMSYTITISADLKDRWGTALGKPYTYKISTKPAQPGYSIPMLQMGASVLFLRPQDTGLPANATSIRSVKITRSDLTLDEFYQLFNSSSAQRKDYTFNTSQTWTQPLQMPLGELTAVQFQLTTDKKPLKPGLYLVDITSPQAAVETYSPIPFLAVVSRVQLTLKITHTAMMVWAVNMDTNQPIASLPVKLYDDFLSSVGDCTTDISGLCSMPVPPLDEERYSTNYFVVTGEPGDDLFGLASSTWNQGINPWEFRVSSRYDYSQPFIYLYSDRPIYRPGQTVYLRGIVRTENNGRYVSPPAAPVNLEVYGPPDYPGAESRLITAKSNPLSPYGTFDLSVALPETALPGGYSVRIKDTGRVLLGFDVQEYRKPEVDLSVKAVKKDLEKGSDLNANVQADFFFGAPAGDLPVSWTLYSRRAYFDLPGYITGTVDNSWFYPYWYYFGDSDGFVTEGSGKTGSDGSFEIDIPTAKVDRLEKRSIEELVLEANILDSNGQQVSSRASVLRHPANFYIGVKPDTWSGTSGKEFGYNIQTVDWNKKPSADHTLTAKFQKVNYKYVVTGGQYGEGSYEPEYTLVSSVDFRTGADGRARLTFTPPSAGLYQLEVTDGKAVTQVQTWVGGEGVAGWPDLPDQHLKLEANASQYLAGQTAHIFVPNPYAGQALALVTIERSEIMQRMVLPISGSNYDLAIPVTDDFAPNVYVSVILLGSNENGAPDFRMGYQTLTVDPGAQKLNVQLVGQPQRTTPGGQVTFTLRVTDAQGLPVTGEFSLAIVDKAVLALADPNSPNIMDAFYGEQPLGVSTALSLGVYANRIQPAPAGRGGGGGDMIMAPPGAREKFADTAFWNGAVTTDQLGLAEVKVTLPDNTTTWVVAVRGLDSRTRVGETTLDVVATKDLLIRPVTPRFAVSGDHIRISALVHNNTSNSLDTKVSLSASNFLLDDVSLVGQEVKIPAGGSQRVDWWGTVQEMETLDLIFSAESGNLKDATKPTVGQIPVVKYTAPMTFATAGVVDQGGERQEIIGLPRSYKPVGGTLRVELSPSIGAVMIRGLKSMEAFPYDFTEAVVSRLLVNLETLSLVRDYNWQSAALPADLTTQIRDGLARLLSLQNNDGGWGWWNDSTSDPYLSAYAAYCLDRAVGQDFVINPTIIDRVHNYISANLPAISIDSRPYDYDQLVFMLYVLKSHNAAINIPEFLWEKRANLDPWSSAMLAMIYGMESGSNEKVQTLLSDLKTSAIRSATGLHWEDRQSAGWSYVTPNFSTAVVLYTLAKLDPASPMLPDAMRYLVSTRKINGGWNSSYENSWVLMSMGQAMRATGDLQANFGYSSQLNGAEILEGKADAGTSLDGVQSELPLSALDTNRGNLLRILRDPGPGRLYYRVYLELNRSAQSAEAQSNGLTISRSYSLAGSECGVEGCPAIDAVTLGDSLPTVLVRLTLTLPNDMYTLMVKDFIPAGAEIANARLKTTRQQPGSQELPEFQPSNPFQRGYGWWLFRNPQVYDDHILWTAQYVPAGTYELTYRIVPQQAGDYQVLPAHAWEYYFPEVMGTSAGGVFKVLPAPGK